MKSCPVFVNSDSFGFGKVNSSSYFLPVISATVHEAPSVSKLTLYVFGVHSACNSISFFT
jgi:hypothetical protein